MKNKLIRKGKYNLFSFDIKDYLIIYKSLNRTKKFVGISIFFLDDLYNAIECLNSYLSKELIKYYSIQMAILDSCKYTIILNFEESIEKEIIIKFSQIFKEITKSFNSAVFYEKNILEEEYFKIITKKKEMYNNLIKSNNILVLKNGEKNFKINCYDLNLDVIIKKQFFLTHFLKILRNLNRKGFLIFTFKKDFTNIIQTTFYLIDINSNDDSVINIQKELNEFYGITLIKKIELNFKDFFRIFWRLNVSENWFYYKKIKIFFIPQKLPENYQKVFDSLERKFKEDHVNYIQINKDFFLIEKKYIVFVLSINSDVLIKLLKKFASKYLVYIIIIKKEQYIKMKKYINVNVSKNFTFIHLDDFLHKNLKQPIVECTI